jgi:hypothetical protein
MTTLNVTYAASFWRQRRFWSTILIALWFAWLALMLRGCSDATPHLPLLMFVNAPLWLLLVALTGLVAGRRLIRAAAVGTAIGLSLLMSDWDFRLRCKLSEAALRQFVAEQQTHFQAAKDQGAEGDFVQRDVTPQRVGLFWVDGVEQADGVVLVRTSHGFVLDYFGIACAPQGRELKAREGMYVYWHLYGNWYGYQFDA